MTRTAVVAGTATAVSNRVSRRQAERWDQQAYEEQAAYAPPPMQTTAPPQMQTTYVAPPEAPTTPTGLPPEPSQLTADLERLASLRSQGLLSEDEFAAAKAKLLAL